VGDTGRLTRALSIVGTILVWLPLVAPVALGLARFVQAGRLQIDYLMPAELFIVGLVGSVLLLWAALRARSYRGLVAGSLAAAVVMLVAGLSVASLTGLASGAVEASGWRIVVVIGLLAGYVMALCVLGVGGVLLTRRLLLVPRAGD
jgi:hypothetical protein